MKLQTKAEQLSVEESAKRMKKFRDECSHENPSWEINPKTKIMTERCPRCGCVLETIEAEGEEDAVD